MIYCKRCLYPANHPLGLVFDAQGVCSGCRVHEEKDNLDWIERGHRLESIFKHYRGKAGARFDCIVPVSGARDSWFIVDLVKRVHGMNPLTVSYNRHYNTERGIRNLAYLRASLDVDYVQQIVAPQTVKRVIRETLYRRGSFHWHAIAGQTVWPVQIAVKLKIPLIVWGHHQGLDQVGMFSHTDEVEMTRKYRMEHDLMGLEAEDLVGGPEGLMESDLVPWIYPHDRELASVGVRGIYLGNFVRWDTKAQHERMLDRYGYETAPQARTFDTYSDVDCLHYSGLHDWVKFRKWGYSKVTDHATREIRLRRMSREEGVAFMAQYQDVPPPDKAAFLSWSGVSEAEFDASIDRLRDPTIWSRDGSGQWVLTDDVTRHARRTRLEPDRLERREDRCEFRVTENKDPAADKSRPVLMARGHVDGHPPRNILKKPTEECVREGARESQ
jgi:N-acetyl sugar amidotransferase